ncbi:MAG: tRNA lysidine(34) synthetase TilS [Actinobacteria bacterium]|uniref:tRNA(Ile)-lysidine synthetase n=1 Tax=freshwater metagenome TaxID=449393 RepID=A0A6J7MU45_9ZZZZ|nr:tRNA lysidine(34) synthetase TilS [Actinomycetota bacterium]MSX79624.1 tRNA lysidine(34) synthetase TilS [Actinomycetota bacterium]
MTRPADLLQRCTFPDPGFPVTCAVSGGADSLALLVLATYNGCVVTAVHVDHGVRPESAGEADVVAAAADRFGASFIAERIRVEPGPNLEARMRAARYGVLPPDVLTGHTADDQAETVLLNLLRGAGRAGLAGMGPERHPILRLRRSETEALCASLGLQPVSDPSNASRDFSRNRVRHELLPLANDIAQRDVPLLIARTAATLREDEDLLEQLASTLDPTDARALVAAPRPLAVRAVRRWLVPFLCGYPPDLAAVERVLDVAAGRSGACEIGGGVTIRRSAQHLTVLTTPPTPAR